MTKTNFKNIGVFGGSFEPPHKGHLYISERSLKLLKLKKIIWAITKKNPFKKKTFFSLRLRKKLCLNLIKRNKKIELKYYENKIMSPTSIKLIKYLKKRGNYNVFFIIGADNLINLHKWKNFKELIKLTKLVVFSRKGFDTKAKKSVILKYLNKKNFIFFKNIRLDISSTKLRDAIINGSK